MALSEGDYRAVEEKATATLLADTGPGGLREGPRPPVSRIEAGDPGLIGEWGQDDFPAILIRATGKTESPAQPACAVLKTFAVRFTVLARGRDRGQLERTARRIAARLELVVRDQTGAARQFQGLPDLIEAAEGVLVASLQETRFPETEARADHLLARAEADTIIQVPSLYRYE